MHPVPPPLCLRAFCVLALEVLSALLVLLLLFLNTWYIGGVFAYTLRWNAPILVLLSLCHCLLLVLESYKPYPLNLYLISFLGFVLYAGIHSTCLSPVPTLAKRECFLIGHIFLAAHLAYNLWGSTVFKQLVLLGFLGIAGLEIGVAFYQYYLNPYWLPEGLRLPVYSGRSSGTFGSPNHFAGFLSLLFFPSLAAFFRGYGPKLVHGFIFLGCFLLLWGLGLAFSRGAFLGLAIALFCFPLLMSQKRAFLGRYIPWILIFGLVCGILFYCQLTVFQNRLHFTLESGIDSMRLAFWKAALYLFLEHPLFGQGAASFNDLFERFRPPDFIHEPIWAHNEYLNTLCDYGGLGFVLAFLPLALSLRQVIKTIKRSPHWLSVGLCLSLLAYAVHCVFDFNCRIPGLWLTATLAYTLLLRLSTAGACTLPGGYSLSMIAVSIIILCLSLALVFFSWPCYQADKIYQEAKETLCQKEAEGGPNLSSLDYIPLEKRLIQGLALEPTHAELWFELSKVYYSLYSIEADPRLREKSLSAIEKARENRRIYWVYWAYYGLHLIRNGEVSTALGALQTALNLAPFQWQTWYYYAFCLKLENTRPDKALEALEHCLRLRPNHSLAKELKADIQSQLAIPPPSV